MGGGGSASSRVSAACSAMQHPRQYVSPVEELDIAVQSYDSPRAVEVFQIGVPILCPDQTGSLQKVVEGKVPFGSGTYEIGSGLDQLKPGTYRTTHSVDDCYWERTRPDGQIIQNNSATHAKSITVTIKANDGSFTSQRCGTWELVE
jgi:hypothetical protein